MFEVNPQLHGYNNFTFLSVRPVRSPASGRMKPKELVAGHEFCGVRDKYTKRLARHACPCGCEHREKESKL
jgi:hypothetical protein